MLQLVVPYPVLDGNHRCAGVVEARLNLFFSEVPVNEMDVTLPPVSPSGSHDRAVLLYEYVGKRTVDLQHTEVPDAYRGRGIAKHLAKAAMDFVVEEDLKAHLTCWYIQKYVKENPQPQYLERVLH
ncbi:hypothetical protein JZ751_026273 [Albula glossodonta]|uniref:Protein NATD1 n=1 Tax=Albula glossodonta TaxID=121402 RepID=A0A8T2PD05_9TELE|nr:hypothetical protein JZ751_026273 [Albula glossodonta]